MPKQLHLGGCLCGDVRYRVSGPATNLCLCHCASCRRASGAPSVAWGTFERRHFEVTRGHLAEHNSSAEVLRGFCATCGSALTYRHSGRDEDIDVTLATLDDAAAFAPQAHIWVQDKLPWVTIDDGLPQYASVNDGTKEPRIRALRPGYRTITPRIVAEDAAGLVTFIQQVFGASGDYDADHPTQLQIGDSSLLVSGDTEREAIAGFIYVYLEDVDASYQRALQAGARSIEPPRMVPYGDYRYMIQDRWGNTWQVARFAR